MWNSVVCWRDGRRGCPCQLQLSKKMVSVKKILRRSNGQIRFHKWRFSLCFFICVLWKPLKYVVKLWTTWMNKLCSKSRPLPSTLIRSKVAALKQEKQRQRCTPEKSLTYPDLVMAMSIVSSPSSNSNLGNAPSFQGRLKKRDWQVPQIWTIKFSEKTKSWKSAEFVMWPSSILMGIFMDSTGPNKKLLRE